MNHLQNPGREGARSDRAETDPQPPKVAQSSPSRRPYVAPRIVSSKIFHKVMLSSPTPGFPGCSTY